MRRLVPWLWPFVLLAGCGGEPDGPRDVPITRPGRATNADDARDATSPPRAIATH